MDKAELERRTKAFALRIIGFVASLPKNKVTDVLGYQLLKAGTSIGANYREANRAVSRNDFINNVAFKDIFAVLQRASSKGRLESTELLRNAYGHCGGGGRRDAILARTL